MKYFIQETFTSLKGEGLYTGVPMHFIRLSGCNLNCEFCDTEYTKMESKELNELVEEVASSPISRVVITGGEPCIHPLRPLVDALHLAGKLVHLETNGTLPIDEGLFDWIALSPKAEGFPLSSSITQANEIKFLVGFNGWKDFIDSFLSSYIIKKDCILYVMPITLGLNQGQTRSSKDFINDNVEDAIEYCTLHPEFRFCIQLHKVLQIP
jgi:organic radical activating enzyme